MSAKDTSERLRKHSELVSEVYGWCLGWILCSTVNIAAYAGLMPMYFFYARQLGEHSSSVISATVAAYFVLLSFSDFGLLWITNDAVNDEQRRSEEAGTGQRYGMNERVFLCQFWTMLLGLLLASVALDFAMLTVGFFLTAIGLVGPGMIKALMIRMLPQEDAIRLTNVQNAFTLLGLISGQMLSGFIGEWMSIRAVFIFFAALSALATVYLTLRLFGRESRLCEQIGQFESLYRDILAERVILDELKDESHQFPIARSLAGLRTAEEHSLVRRFTLSGSATETEMAADPVPPSSPSSLLSGDEQTRQFADQSQSRNSEIMSAMVSIWTVLFSWEYLPTLLAHITVCILFGVDAMAALWLNPYLDHRFGSGVSIGGLILASMSVSTAIGVVILTRVVIPRVVLHADSTPESRELSLSWTTACALGLSGGLSGLLFILIAPEINRALWFFAMFTAIGIPCSLCMALSEAEVVRGNVQSLTGKLAAIRLLISGIIRGFLTFITGIAWKWKSPSILTNSHRDDHLWFLYIFALCFLMMALLPNVYFWILRPIRMQKMKTVAYQQITDEPSKLF